MEGEAVEDDELQAVTELEAVGVVTDVVEELVTEVEETVTESNEMVIETLETGEEDLVETNLDNQIVDWNDEVQNVDDDVDVQEVSLKEDLNLNPPESISLDSSDIKAEVTQGVNELRILLPNGRNN